MRFSILVCFVTALAVGTFGCSSGSSSTNNPKLVNQPDPKLQPVTPSGAGGNKAKSVSQ